MDTKFLRELIEKNTRVILPEFGAFLVKDDGSGTFKPENITFSPFLRYNDGMVEDTIASKKNISKDDARVQLNQFIENLKDKLAQNKSVPLEELGSLYLDKRGSVHFSTSEGVPPKEKLAPPKDAEVKEPKKEEASIEKKQEKETPKEDKKEKTLESDLPKEPKPASETKENIEPKAKEAPKKDPPKAEKEERKNKVEPKVPPKPEPTKQQPQKTETPKETKSPKSGSGTLKAVLAGSLVGVGLVVLAIGGWYIYSSGMLDFSKSNESTVSFIDETDSKDKAIEQEEKNEEERETVDKGKFDEEFEKLSSQMDQSASNDRTTSQKTAPRQTRTQITTDSTEDERISISYPQEGMFHIIVGSFRNLAYAEKFSDDMRTSGFKSRVIKQPTGMHAVTLGSFTTRNEASDSMSVWKSKHPNIWILHQ